LTGASSGIGHRLALELAERGAWLVLAARNTAKLEQVRSECRAGGGRAFSVSTDVAQEAQCEALIKRTVGEYGRIDTLVNNAGIGLGGRFEELHDLTPAKDVMQVNFFGSLYCSYYALPYLKETKGRLVAISSLAGRFPAPNAAAYAASKHAMAGFFDSLRVELAGTGVSVTTIYPGWVATGISSRAMDVEGKPIGEISAHEKNAMTPEACARLIVKGIAERRREIVMTAQGKLGLWLRRLAPGLVDRVSRRLMS
jgi:short-subunit dehydrogenase